MQSNVGHTWVAISLTMTSNEVYFSVDKEIISYHFQNVKILAKNKHFQRSKALFTVTLHGLNDANPKSFIWFAFIVPCTARLSRMLSWLLLWRRHTWTGDPSSVPLFSFRAHSHQPTSYTMCALCSQWAEVQYILTRHHTVYFFNFIEVSKNNNSFKVSALLSAV